MAERPPFKLRPSKAAREEAKALLRALDEGGESKYKRAWDPGVVGIHPKTGRRYMYARLDDVSVSGFDPRNVAHAIRRRWKHGGLRWEWADPYRQATVPPRIDRRTKAYKEAQCGLLDIFSTPESPT